MADTTAVISAADRPPTSAITMVKARKAKARLDAEVSVRSGTSTTPRISAPRPPTAIQIKLSFRAPMPLLLPPATVRVRTHRHRMRARAGTEASEPTTSPRGASDDESSVRKRTRSTTLLVGRARLLYYVAQLASRSRQGGARPPQRMVKMRGNGRERRVRWLRIPRRELPYDGFAAWRAGVRRPSCGNLGARRAGSPSPPSR